MNGKKEEQEQDYVTWEELEMVSRKARDQMSSIDPRGTWHVLDTLFNVISEVRLMRGRGRR